MTLPSPAVATPRPNADDPELTPPEPAGPGQSTIHRVIGGAMVLLSTQPITWAATLLLTVYLPRYLDGHALGEFSIAMATAALVGTLATFGLPTILTRTVASGDPRASAAVSAGLVMVVGLSLLGAVVTMLLGLSGYVLNIGLLVLGLAMAGMIVVQVQALFLAVLAGQHRLGEFAWVNAVAAFLGSVGSIGALMLGGGPAAMLVVTLVVAVASTAFLWHRLGIPFDASGLTRSSLLGLGKSGLPFAAWNILLRVRGDLDSIVLGGLLSIEAVGWWAAAQRIVSIPIFVPTLVTTPLLPALSSVRSDREMFTRTLRRTFELTVVATTGISAAIAAFAPLVPTTLGWAESYGAAVPVMQLMAPMLILVSISMVLGTGLIGLGLERRWLLVNAIATALQYVVLFTAIPAAQASFGNGSIGAVLGRIAAELVMVAGAVVLLPRGVIGWSSWFFAARTGVVGLAAVVAVLPLLDQSLILAGAVGVLTYGAGLLVLRVILPDELRSLVLVTLATVRRRAHVVGVAAPSVARPEQDGGSSARP